ncbi:MAG: hypothetical protein QW228_08385 [Candidatus Aenigmatarchaeota archaeon]
MKNSLRKGKRVEYQIRDLLRKLGPCERVPCSGNARAFKGDLVLFLKDRELHIEVKARAQGFKQFYAWLEKVDLLIVKADRKDPLIVLPFKLFEELLNEKK